MFKKTESTRLGEILISKGLITPEQLIIATQEQTKRKHSQKSADGIQPRAALIGEILVELGFIDQLESKRGLNWQQRLRHVSIAMALCAPFMVFAPAGASAQTTSNSSTSSTANRAFTPITIQAENYTTMSGVWNEPTSDVGGGQDTGNINTGDWMSYANTTVNIPATGTYKITYRLASLNTTGSLVLKEVSTNAVLDTIPVPITGGWQKWVDVTRTVTLTQGDHSFKLLAAIGGFNLNWFKIEAVSAAITSSSSSKASSLNAASNSSNNSIVASSSSSKATSSSNSSATSKIASSASSLASSSASSTSNTPSWTIQAENYTSMSGVWNETTTDIGGGQDTGNINTGDWMSYTNTKIDIPATGIYKVTMRVASLNTAGSLVLKEDSTGVALDTIPIPVTGGWQKWVDVTRSITLTKGSHSFKLFAATGGFNLNWFKIEATASSPPISSSSSSASTALSTLVKGPVGLRWMAPSQRENGDFLDITEVGGYEIRYRLASANTYSYITINDAWTNQYNFPWLEGEYIFQIAAFDKNGIYSNFTNITPI
ncbi:MAG TPA: carbohydrate-binding protein [Cellvibrio sp.]|nr:carbohydrate-binding protein [Cellvibrio sp.]